MKTSLLISNLAAGLLSLSLSASIEAAPLPKDTLLIIEPGINDGVNCISGSCFAMEVAPGFWIWTNYEAGTDGGFIVGKAQASGGQDTDFSSTNSAPGELTAAWAFAGNYGTLSTLPGGGGNIFDDQPCAGADCAGKTEINTFFVAWNGNLIPLGGGLVASWDITLDGTGGGNYALDYYVTIPLNDPSGFGGVNFRMVARGGVVLPPVINNPPTANDVNVSTESGVTTSWAPSVFDPDSDPLSCSISSNPSNGFATVDTDCAIGTYTSGDGFAGVDCFSYETSDGEFTATAIVCVTVVPPMIPNCLIENPMKQVTTTGGGQSRTVNDQILTRFTGHITTEAGLITGGKNSVKICTGTTLQYEAIATSGNAVCLVNGSVAQTSGNLTTGDKLICTSKPDGEDTDRFSIKAGTLN